MPVVIENNILKSTTPLVTPDESLASFLLKRLEELGNKELLVDIPSRRVWSAAKLKASILTLAEALIIDIGLKKGEIVAFSAPNSDYLAITQMAVLAAGGVYTGVDHKLSYRDLMACVVETQPSIIVCYKNNVDTIAKVLSTEDSIKCLVIDGDADCVKAHPNCQPLQRLIDFQAKKSVPLPVPVDNKLDSSALLLSQGTTGKPKAVIRTNENLVSFCTQFAHPTVSIVTETDVTISTEPLYVLVGLIVLLSGLVRGAKTLVLPEYDTQTYLKAVNDFKVTVVALVPSHLSQLIKSVACPACTGLSKFNTSSIKHIVTMGAYLNPKLVEEATLKLKLESFRQGYGMTEAGMISITPRELKNPQTVGLPLPGVQIKIVNTDNVIKVLGPKEVGEILVKSSQVTPGYRNNQEHLDNKIIDSEGFFMTADGGFFDTDGQLYIVDRYKSVIKVDAKQVSPTELEQIINFHEGVKYSAVVGIPSDTLGEVPKAFVVLEPGYKLTANNIVDYVASQVAEYKQLKGGAEIISSLPLTESGRIDRACVKSLIAKK